MSLRGSSSVLVSERVSERVQSEREIALVACGSSSLWVAREFVAALLPEKTTLSPNTNVETNSDILLYCYSK